MVGLAAGILQVLSAFPYLKDMLWGTTRPNLVSWSIWLFAVSISMAAQMSAGATWSLAVVASAVIMDGTIVLFALFGYGYTKFGRVEGICLALSLSAIILWQLTSNPLIALVFSISADAIAYIPTFVKSYRDPSSETVVVWFILAVTGLLGILATTRFDFRSGPPILSLPHNRAVFHWSLTIK